MAGLLGSCVFFRLLLLLASLLVVPCWVAAEPLSLNLKGEAAFVINADTGAVLYAHDADKSLYPASLTKIGTALYMLNRGGVDLDSIVTVESEAIVAVSEDEKRRANYTLPAYYQELDGTHIGLKKGEQISLRDLLYGLMLASGNDAANAIALYVSGSIPKFMEECNAYLAEIGCTNTHFMNPHGLHHPDHVSTARDLATMAREALKNPILADVVSTVRHVRPETNMQESSTFTQGNMLLRKGKHYYPKAIGVKTGYHRRAGKNIVAAARSGDRTLIAVLLKNADRAEMFDEAIDVFEKAFRQPQVERTLLTAGPQPYSLKISGSRHAVGSVIAEDVRLRYYPAEEPDVRATLQWDDIVLPISKGQRIGEIRLLAEGGRLLDVVPLFADQDVRPSVIYRIRQTIMGVNRYVWGSLLLVSLGVAVYLLVTRRSVRR